MKQCLPPEFWLRCALVSITATFLNWGTGIVLHSHLLITSPLAIALVVFGSVSGLISTLVAMLLNGLLYRFDSSLSLRPGVWWLLISTISWAVMWMIIIGTTRHMVRDYLFFVHILIGSFCLAGLQWIILRAVISHPLKWTLWGFGGSIVSFWGVGALFAIPQISLIVTDPTISLIAFGIVFVLLENGMLADIQHGNDEW